MSSAFVKSSLLVALLGLTSVAMPVEVAEAARLSPGQLKRAMAKAKRMDRTLRKATQRIIDRGQLQDGAVVDGYQVTEVEVGKSSFYRIEKQGTAGASESSSAHVVGGESRISIFTRLARQERGGESVLHMSFRGEEAKELAGRPRTIVESGVRSNGDAPESRYMMRYYDLDGAGRLVAVTTNVSENDGNIRRPTSRGTVKDVRDEDRRNDVTYVADPEGRLGAQPANRRGPGMYVASSQPGGVKTRVK